MPAFGIAGTVEVASLVHPRPRLITSTDYDNGPGPSAHDSHTGVMPVTHRGVDGLVGLTLASDADPLRWSFILISKTEQPLPLMVMGLISMMEAHQGHACPVHIIGLCTWKKV